MDRHLLHALLLPEPGIQLVGLPEGHLPELGAEAHPARALMEDPEPHCPLTSVSMISGDLIARSLRFR